MAKPGHGWEEKPSAVDEYAANELAGYLRQITGAQFPVVAADGMAEGKPPILIGLSAPRSGIWDRTRSLP